MSENELKGAAAAGFVTIEDAGRHLGLKRSKVYQLVNDGRLAAVRIDGARRISRESLLQFSEQLLAGASR